MILVRERRRGPQNHQPSSPSPFLRSFQGDGGGNQWIDGVHSRDSAIKEGPKEGAFVALIKLRRDRRKKGRASEMDCSAVKTVAGACSRLGERATGLLDGLRSNEGSVFADENGLRPFFTSTLPPRKWPRSRK